MSDVTAEDVLMIERIAGARTIVARIMTMHWDMKACECWVCEAGRKADIHPNSKLLRWRDEGFAYVEVKA